MIDPFTSLAFSVYSNKGAFALLLGSGISRASGIPTGWEVVLDLIRKVAAVEREDCEPDPAAWFRTERGEEPDYSKLLDTIASTPTERQQLLRRYFEPTEDEKAEGLKLPSLAHKAIARLVASGHIRVIVTTNFDRLMERALEEVSISPTVVSSPDQLSGALPLAHSGATIIKVHGDYLDTRIRNTESELASYEAALDSILDRIFDEYGLIISGWPGDWDAALRAAIERCPSRRFTTFWATRSDLSQRAESLVKHRRAQIVQCKDADLFFATLEEKVQALEDLAAPHPLSAKIAVATVKRYIVEPLAKIRLHDLIHEETERLLEEIRDPIFVTSSNRPPAEELLAQIKRYQALSEVLISIMATGAYWSNGDQQRHWVSIVRRISESRGVHGGMDYLIKLRYYPTLLLMYAAGMASIASGNIGVLSAVLTESKVHDPYGGEKELCSIVYTTAVIQNEVGYLLPGLERSYTPTSDHLHEVLRDYFREYLPGDTDYDEAFDRFEYFFGLVHADLNDKEFETGKLWGPVGRFAWRKQHSEPEERIYNKVDREIGTVGEEWVLVRAGLFGGSIERARSSKGKFDAFIKSLNWF